MVIGPCFHAGEGFGRTDRIHRILAPTDFGHNEKKLFRQVVAMAQEMGFEIAIYHAIPRPVEPIYQTGVYLLGSPWVPIHEYYAKEVIRRERRARAWARWAENQGVRCEVILDTEVMNIAESIARIARERKFSWIAMSSHSGAIASMLLGSVTRQVIRSAECPVWVVRRGFQIPAEKKAPRAA
jgi:nucleotide-binding universal stress UspA family protein